MPAHEIHIESQDYWFKIIEMLQQNWALIDPHPAGGVRVFFVSDSSGVFDQIDFSDAETAALALRRNGFRRLVEDAGAKSFIHPPPPPFHARPHPRGAIYSSGEFWV